jgi:hypothetical protein
MPITIDGSGTITGVNASGGLSSAQLVNAADITSGTLPKARLPAGSILQVVQTSKTDAFSTTTTQPTYVDVTGMSVSITPTSASSRILILCSFQLSSNNATVYANARLLRDSTAIFIGDANGSNARASAATGLSQTFSAAGSSIAFVDSPATTSAITYKIQMAKGEGGGTIFMNRSGDDDTGTNRARTPSSIIVMEIAG